MYDDSVSLLTVVLWFFACINRPFEPQTDIESLCTNYMYGRLMTVITESSTTKACAKCSAHPTYVQGGAHITQDHTKMPSLQQHTRGAIGSY